MAAKLRGEAPAAQAVGKMSTMATIMRVSMTLIISMEKYINVHEHASHEVQGHYDPGMSDLTLACGPDCSCPHFPAKHEGSIYVHQVFRGLTKAAQLMDARIGDLTWVLLA